MIETSENKLIERKRHKDNSNLKLYWSSTYRDKPLMPRHLPYIEEYLESLHGVIEDQVKRFPRTTAIRFELKYPTGYEGDVSNKRIGQFIKRAKYRLHKAFLNSTATRVYKTEFNYFWVREQDGSESPHYHFLLLLNKDAYNGLGRYDSRHNLYGMLRESWAGALGLSWDESVGLVSASAYKGIPDSTPYNYVNMNNPFVNEELESLFYRASYLCKSSTKTYQGRERSFGCSQVDNF